MAMTRDTILRVQAERANRGLRPLTVQEMAEALVPNPEPRHYARAFRLMNSLAALSAAAAAARPKAPGARSAGR